MPVRSLKDGTITIEDRALVGSTPNSVTVDLEQGDLSWTEQRPVNIVSDRGVLSHARMASEVAYDVSFSMMFQSFSKHATTTPYDALTRTGGASAWASTEPKGDAYATNLKFTITDPAGGASEEVFLEQFILESHEFSEGDDFDTLTVNGRAQRNPLLRAEALWQANKYTGVGSLLDLTGNGHDAQLGSTSGSDTNDPKWLPYAGEKYGDFPSGTSDFIDATNADIGSLTGNKTITADIAPDDWTPGTEHVFFNKQSGNDGILFRLTTSGQLQLLVGDGAGLDNLVSVAAVGLTDGTRHTVAAVWDDGTGVQYQVDGVNVGSNVASSKTLTNAAVNGEIGKNFTGKIYSVTVTDSASTTHASPNFDDDAASPFATFTDTETNTWTLNRSATGRKLAVVDRPMFLLGTDDYLEVADDANLDASATRSITAVFAGRLYDAGTLAFIVKKSLIDDAGVAGWAAWTTGSNSLGEVGDGTVKQTNTHPIAIVVGVAFMAGVRRDVPSDDVSGLRDGSTVAGQNTDPTTTTLVNALPLRIGSDSGTPARFFDGEFFAAALFRSALSDEDVKNVGDRLLAIKANS